MVLKRIVLGALLVAGCKQSLFDSHSGDDTTTDANGGVDVMVPSSCGAMCLADAGTDFDGTPGGKNNHWKYFEDHRDRTWAAMSAAGMGFVGADAANTITPCSAMPTAEACTKLMGGLLISTSGHSSPSGDPAIQFTSTSPQVITLSIRVYVPSGADQGVRLYRNSREDVLFSGNATAGNTVETTITVDALANDRFLLALAPDGTGATSIGVQFFVNATATAFPNECQLGLSFTGPAPSTPAIPNACGGQFTSRTYDVASQTATDIAPTYTDGPFPEMGMAGRIALTQYYKGADVMNRAGDTTTQLWMRHDAFDGTYDAVIYSDSDLDNAGGVAIFRLNGGNVGAQTCTDVSGMTFVCPEKDGPYPTSGWHFIRVVHSAGTVKICVDGTRVGSYALPAGKMATMYVPYIGKDVIWSPNGAYFDGAVDDVRVLKTALPCN